MERIIDIDRTVPFDLVKLLGKNGTIEEQDERSLALRQVDLTNIRLEYMLLKKEAWISGEERLRRLKEAGHIRLDAKVFQKLWENQELIPELWKKETDGYPTFIFFDGSIFREPNSYRYVLYLCWRDGQWHWNYQWLEGVWPFDDTSAVLANK